MGPKQDEVLKAIAEVKRDTGDIKGRLDIIDQAVKSNKNTLDLHERKLDQVTEALNDREQHSRNSSIRIFGMSISKDAARDAIQTAKTVYDTVLKVILDEAVKNKDLHVVPQWFEVIEHCHTLKDIKDVGKPPVIVRFQCRLMRHLIFKYKKVVLTNVVNNLTNISIVEDLTSLNYKRLKDLRSKDVTAWTLSGRIYYMDKDNVKKRL